MKMRAAHRLLGLLTAPLMLVTAVCGLLLLYRKAGLYDRSGEFRETIEHLHNYEIVAPYVGTVAAGLMIVLSATGLALLWQIRARRRKGR